MSGYYPPGVTGCEPQICGTGLEDYCDRCIEEADEDTTVASLGAAEVEMDDGRWLCVECANKEREEENDAE